jgi:hypothetical protein
MKRITTHAIAVVLAIFATAAVMRSQQGGTQRFPQFENEDVKVWKSIVYPNPRSTCTATIIPASSSRSKAAP